MNFISARNNRPEFARMGGDHGCVATTVWLSRLGAFAIVAACIAATVFALPAAAATGPNVTVEPSTGLAPGQTVVVTGTGFPPAQSVFVTECSSVILSEPQPKSATDAIENCGGAQQIFNSDANGNFTTTFAVQTEFVSFTGATVSCATPGSCAVTAAYFAGGFWFFGRAISFAVDSTADTVVVSPPDAVNTVGTSHTVTATATSAGQPVSDAVIVFHVSGSTSASGSCTTNSSGQCSFTYQGPQLPGADVISACADNNRNGVADTGEACGTATKAWILPSSTSGQTTGGGQIWNATHTDKIAFGFTAKSTSTGVKGECSVVDPSANVKVKCTDATALVQGATHATFFGNATVNGVATTYRIDVDDLGEPGAGRDTFSIQTTTGYTAGGVLTNGNVQVHP